jgi:hypothetical protein
VSLPFRGVTQYYFDFPPLPEFIEKLEAIERTLVGEAKLGQLYEESWVMFEGDGKGYIAVSGLLVDYGARIQKLHFSFTTDQTAPGPFIRGLAEAVSRVSAA